MQHSNRAKIHWGLFLFEIILFTVGVFFAPYLAAVQNWPHYFWISLISIILFVIVKLIDAFHSLQT